MPRATVSNAPMPPPPADGKMRPRKYHYISFAMDADADGIAEECNRRALAGYRLHTAHFYGTTNPQALLIFERRLRRPLPKREPAREAGGPNLDAPCPECRLGSELGAMQMTPEHVTAVRATGRCPNCDTAWPRNPPLSTQPHGA